MMMTLIKTKRFWQLPQELHLEGAEEQRLVPGHGFYQETLVIGGRRGLLGVLARASRVVPLRSATVAFLEVIPNTPFLVQIGGRNVLLDAGNGTFTVADTQKIQPDVFGHHGKLESGTLAVGDVVQARVDAALSRTRLAGIPHLGRDRGDHRQSFAPNCGGKAEGCCVICRKPIGRAAPASLR